MNWDDYYYLPKRGHGFRNLLLLLIGAGVLYYFLKVRPEREAVEAPEAPRYDPRNEPVVDVSAAEQSDEYFPGDEDADPEDEEAAEDLEVADIDAMIEGAKLLEELVEEAEEAGAEELLAQAAAMQDEPSEIEIIEVVEIEVPVEDELAELDAELEALAEAVEAEAAAAAKAEEPLEPEPEAASEAEGPAEPASPRWLQPVDGECPPGHPIKARFSTGRFHLPGDRGYEKITPDCCYASEEDAVADGFTHSRWS